MSTTKPSGKQYSGTASSGLSGRGWWTFRCQTARRYWMTSHGPRPAFRSAMAWQIPNLATRWTTVFGQQPANDGQARSGQWARRVTRMGPRRRRTGHRMRRDRSNVPPRPEPWGSEAHGVLRAKGAAICIWGAKEAWGFAHCPLNEEPGGLAGMTVLARVFIGLVKQADKAHSSFSTAAWRSSGVGRT